MFNVATIDAEPGSSIELREVLLVTDGGTTTVGSPSVEGAVVTAEVIEHGKGPKVINFKYKAKVRYRRKRGHRQGYTKLEVTSISLGGASAAATAAPSRARRAVAATPAAEAPAAEQPESAAPAAAPASSSRGDNLVDIEGIGATHAQTLEDAGLKTTTDLLEAAGSASGRTSLAEKTGLTAKQILEWVNRADLMRIKGVGSEFSDLLEQSGVDTVKELATRVPANLQTKMAEVNEEKKLTRRTPSVSEVETWVAEAKTLPAMVSH